MTAAWMKSVAARRAKRVATVDATPSESSRNEFAIQNNCPRKARFKYLVRSKSFVITTARNGLRNRFWQSQATNKHGVAGRDQTGMGGSNHRGVGPRSMARPVFRDPNGPLRGRVSPRASQASI